MRAERNKGLRTGLGILVVLLGTLAAYADKTWDRTIAANRHFERGEFEEALERYEEALMEDPARGDLLKMNKGSALLHLGRVDEAEQTYRSITGPLRGGVEADRHHNHGTILFVKGEQALRSGDGRAVEVYRQALEKFKQALRARPGDLDAQWNLELTQARIRELEEQPSDDSQQQPDQDQGDGSDGDSGAERNQEQDRDRQEEEDAQPSEQDDGEEDAPPPPQSGPDDEGSDATAPPPLPDEQEQQEAARILEQFADDAPELAKPRKLPPASGRQQGRAW